MESILMPWLPLLCSLQKRQLASQSLAFNIKDKVFYELFPDVVEVSTVPDFLTDVCMSSKCILLRNTKYVNTWPILDPPPPLPPAFKQEIKQKQRMREELRSRPQVLPLPDVVPDGEAHHAQNGHLPINGHLPPGAAQPPDLQQVNRNHGLLGGALANLFVIVGFAAFAYTVKYVLRSIAQEWIAQWEPPMGGTKGWCCCHDQNRLREIKRVFSQPNKMKCPVNEIESVVISSVVAITRSCITRPLKGQRHVKR